MVGLPEPFGAGVADAIVAKLKSLGVDAREELEPLLRLIKVKGRMRRGEEFARVDASRKYCTILLAGVACWYKRIEDGRCQIFTFQYAGDFCDFHRYVLPKLDASVAVIFATQQPLVCR